MLQQDASSDIIVSHLSAAAKAFGITYESDSLIFASGVALDLSVPESRMFAVELSSYHAGLDSYVKQVAARSAGHRVSGEAESLVIVVYMQERAWFAATFVIGGIGACDSIANSSLGHICVL